ncbi:MAG: hypothetical protein ACFCVK_22825 [Acidimicrobiales bacterium]
MYNFGRLLGWSTIGVVAALSISAAFPFVTGADPQLDRSPAANVAAGPIASALATDIATAADTADGAADDGEAATVTVTGPVTAVDMFDGLHVVFDATAIDPADGFGDDAELDELWLACEGGHGAACDQLFESAPVGSDYEQFGLTCGRRPGVIDCRDGLDGAGDDRTP